MLQRITQFLKRLPPRVVLVIAFALLALVGYIDAITGPELTFAHFYLVPVCLVTWARGARWGYVMAFASAGVCLWAEFMGAAVYTNPLLQEWNLLTRLAFFLASVWLLSTWKSMGKRPPAAYVSPSLANVVVNDYVRRAKGEQAPTELDKLTTREREVLQLIAEGNSSAEVAQILYISVRTVDTHRHNIMEKPDIHSIAGLTKFAIRNGLCQLH